MVVLLYFFPLICRIPNLYFYHRNVGRLPLQNRENHLLASQSWVEYDTLNWLPLLPVLLFLESVSKGVACEEGGVRDPLL